MKEGVRENGLDENGIMHYTIHAHQSAGDRDIKLEASPFAKEMLDARKRTRSRVQKIDGTYYYEPVSKVSPV